MIAKAESEATTSIDPQRAGRLMRVATYASVTVASILIVVKLTGWLMTDSVAILSSLVDSILDAGASIINLLAVRHALTPADREHRFGHGKAEALAGLAQAAFIAGSAVFLLFQAGERLIDPRLPVQSEVGIAIILFSIVLTLGLVAFQMFVVRRTGSVAISADSLHYRSDLLMNIGVIAALVLTAWFGLAFIDPLFAAAIAAYILYGAVQIFRGAIDPLMDRELPDDQRARIQEIALAHPEVLSLHDLRTRSSGVQTFIQLHLVLDPDMRLIKAHEIADEVEASIMAAFPGAEVIIHQDPDGIEEPHTAFGG